jgi:hypothetical protein
MMKPLIGSIRGFLNKEAIDYRFFTANEGKQLIEMLAARHKIDLNRKWLWEERPAAIAIDYDNKKDWEFAMKTWLPRFDERIVLVVTDDEFFPWPFFEMPKTCLEELLADAPYFEYFVFDLRMEHILFESHEDHLYVLGDTTDRVSRAKIVPLLKNLIAEIVAKNYSRVVEGSKRKDLTAEILQREVEDYPGSMTMPPDSAFEIVQLHGISDEWRSIVMHLWYDDKRGDLAISCLFTVTEQGMEYEIEDIYVP